MVPFFTLANMHQSQGPCKIMMLSLMQGYNIEHWTGDMSGSQS